MAHVTAVNISEKKGVRKHEVPYIDVKCHHGIVGDAHAGDWHRQISLLADESVDTMREACPIELDAGIFAENINTRGIALKTLPVGTRLRVGEALLDLGIVAGDTTEYGLYVKTVNGVTLDYDADGAYWAFYINGEYASTGVDSTNIEAGATYTLKAEAAAATEG